MINISEISMYRVFFYFFYYLNFNFCYDLLESEANLAKVKTYKIKSMTAKVYKF